MASNASRPRILITRAEEVPGQRWDDYAENVANAGGEPIEGALDAVHETPEHDGLLLTGGIDIDPACYGESRSERVLEVDMRRDQWETELINAARLAGRPLFAICRGHQMLNVARGGTLLQHLDEREPHRARRSADGESIDSGWHDVDILPGTRLAAILDRADGGTMRVNSLHHQAVTTDRVAPKLTVAATTRDGVVESLVDARQPWAVSVQWHPEMEEMAGQCDALWAAFIEASAVAVAQA